MKSLTGRCLFAAAGFLMLFSFQGCGGGVSPDEVLANSNQTNIQRIRNCYNMYLAQHGWVGPADESTFKSYLNGLSGEVLGQMSIDSVEDMFVSERDNEPFKVCYQLQSGPRGSTAPAIFESTGQNGNRLVAFLDMRELEVDAVEYDRLWAESQKSIAEN